MTSPSKSASSLDDTDHHQPGTDRSRPENTARPNSRVDLDGSGHSTSWRSIHPNTSTSLHAGYSAYGAIGLSKQFEDPKLASALGLDFGLSENFDNSPSSRHISLYPTETRSDLPQETVDVASQLHGGQEFVWRGGLFGPESPSVGLSNPSMPRLGLESDEPRLLNMRKVEGQYYKHQARRPGSNSNPKKHVRFTDAGESHPTPEDRASLPHTTETPRDQHDNPIMTGATQDTNSIPRYKPDSSSEPHPDIWSMYLEHTLAEDKETVAAWNSDLDSILIFSALFSAVVTTLVIESYQDLQPDPQVEMMRAVLLQLQKNSDASEIVQSPIPPFKLASSTIRINVYWFSSLIISLSTAFLAILAKQWVNYLLAGLSPVPSTQGRHRQYRMDGLQKWNLPGVVSFLPLLLHIALLLFFAGLVDFVWASNDGIGMVSAVLVVATFLVYASTNLLSYIYPECPFKTSVTVFISLGHEFLIILYAHISHRAFVMREVILAFSREIARTSHVRRTSRRGRPLSSVLSEVHQATTDLRSEKPKYDTLRIASLRAQDERYISQNTSLMDAKIHLWLIHNNGRIANTERLVNMFMQFPSLILHRQLLIREGAPAFLERMLESRFSAPWPLLNGTDRVGVASLVRTLAMMATEAEVDSMDFSPESVPAGTVLDYTPYLPVQRRQQDTDLCLSDGSLDIIENLLGDIHILPLSLASFTLRLSVRLINSGRKEFGSRINVTTLIEDFLLRVMEFRPADQQGGAFVHATNTILYLALTDAEAMRHSGSILVSVSNGDVRYWLTVILNVIHRIPMDIALLRQLCWGVCALSWSMTPQVNDVGIRPLVPRLRTVDTERVIAALVWLLSCDQDREVMSVAVVSIETILWNLGTDIGMEAHSFLREELQELYPIFVHRVSRSLQAKKIQVPDIVRIMVPLVRIGAYLALFAQGHPRAERDMMADMFELINWVVPYRSGQMRTPNAHPNTTTDRVTKAASTYSNTMSRDSSNWRWIYRAICRMVFLYYRSDKPEHQQEFLQPEKTEFIYTDALSTTVDLGPGLVAAVEALSSEPLCAEPERKRRPLKDSTLVTFCELIKNMFLETLQPSTDVREVGAWDMDLGRMVCEAIRYRKILETLLASKHACVHENILAPFVHVVHAALYSGPRDVALDQRHGARTNVWRYDARHLAHQTAASLRFVWVPFLRSLTEGIKSGSHLNPEMHELLIEVIGISGYLAFFERPTEPPQQIVGLAMVHYLRVFIRSQSTIVPVEIRRHVWGTIGRMSALYLSQSYRGSQLADPVQNFRHDRASPEDIAIGLIHILVIRCARMQDGEYLEVERSHCRECALDMDAILGLRARILPEVLTEAALETMLDVWDGTEWEATAIRSRLLYHGCGVHVVKLRGVLEGYGGLLVNRLVTRIQMMPADGHVLQRRRSL